MNEDMVAWLRDENNQLRTQIKEKDREILKLKIEVRDLKDEVEEITIEANKALRLMKP